MIKIIPRVDLHAISRKYVTLLYLAVKMSVELNFFLYCFKLLKFLVFLTIIK
jgi:hypothetical protein